MAAAFELKVILSGGGSPLPYMLFDFPAFILQQHAPAPTYHVFLPLTSGIVAAALACVVAACIIYRRKNRKLPRQILLRPDIAFIITGGT